MLSQRRGGRRYVRKDIAMRNLLPSKSEEPESAAEIRASCKQEIVRFNDPTLELKLTMAVAIADERFEDAARCASGARAIMPLVASGRGRHGLALAAWSHDKVASSSAHRNALAELRLQ